MSNTGAFVCEYRYDAWGNHKVYQIDSVGVYSNGSVALGMTEKAADDDTFIGNINPFRYRGYYLDTETGLYYLQSRYYDPTAGRFINADSVAYLEPEIINGLNLYAYCLNNPVMYTDSTGHLPQWLGWLVNGFIAVAAIAAVVVGTVATGGLLGAALVGAGLGAMIGMSGSIIAQGGFANADAWQIAKAGGIGAAIGAVSGVAAYGGTQLGQLAGTYFGVGLSSTAGIQASLLPMIGFYAGGFAGGLVGGMLGNQAGNWVFASEQDHRSGMDGGMNFPRWMISFFRLMGGR